MSFQYFTHLILMYNTAIKYLCLCVLLLSPLLSSTHMKNSFTDFHGEYNRRKIRQARTHTDTDTNVLEINHWISQKLTNVSVFSLFVLQLQLISNFKNEH